MMVLTLEEKSHGFMEQLSCSYSWVFLVLTSKFYIKTEEKLFHTELNQPVKISSTGKITVLNMEYNPNKDFMIFEFKIEGEGDVGYKFAAQAKSNPNMKLPVKRVI